ncbi:myb/SANT-like DNA-binding domain-containing protein [Ditylenchus destructor]|nr:myb/SANT-like DNA-binding domain-containing protein [Ditylenchus destructor]
MTTFTKDETERLIDLIEEQKEDLFPNSRKLDSSKHSAQAWQDVCDKLNIEYPDGPRKTVDQLRKKYKNIKQRAKQDHQERKRHQGGTGGGPPKKQSSSELFDKVQTMYDGTPSFSGLTSGMETPIFNSPTFARSSESKIKQESLYELQRKVLIEQLAFYQHGGQVLHGPKKITKL